MSKITNQELGLLRTQPHSTKLWLSVYQPSTVLACQVNDASISKGARSITYDNVTEGSSSLVQSGMTLWIGSSAGKDDLGKVRVRSATSSILTIAENDHINWADDLYLTVVSFYEINAVFPRIDQPDLSELEVVFYKDYDIPYTDENEVLGSLICMGPHHAGFLENGQAEVSYSASGTSNLKGDNLTYDWFFEGATVTGSSVQTPGTVVYDTPGHYTTRLIVTNDSGGTDTSHRHVSIYDRPEDGTNNPLLLWQLEGFTGNRKTGGTKVRAIIRETVGEDVLKDGSLVVIFAEDDYGGTKQSIGGNAENRQSIVFVGYVIDGSIEYNYADSLVEFEIGSPTEILKISEGFGIHVESKTSPSTWYELLNMTVKRAIYHFLRWHSTFLLTNDVIFKGTDQNIQFFDSGRENLFDPVKSLMETALVGSAVSDRQGKLWLEVDGYTDGITLETNFTLHNQDWMGNPEIEQRQNYPLAFLEVGGIAYDGPAAGTFSALLASAPGDAPAYKGKIDRFQGLALSDQDQLNTLVGDIFAFRNSEFPNSAFLLAGNYRNFDIAPQENVLINLAPEDTVRELSFAGKKFLVEHIDWIYDARSEFFYPRIVFVENTEGFAGDSIIIPDVPNTGGFGSVLPFEFPPFDFPPFNTRAVIKLYNEGIELGEVEELDFQGGPVEAVLNGTRGDVTFTCSTSPSASDGIGMSRSAPNIAVSCDSEKLISFSIGATDNYRVGMNYDVPSAKLNVQVDGVYSVNLQGYIEEEGAGDPLCNCKNQKFSAEIKVKHYNSADELQSEHSTQSGDIFCFDSGGTDISVTKAGFAVIRILSMEDGDYLQFTTYMECSGCWGSPGTYTLDAMFNVFRIT